MKKKHLLFFSAFLVMLFMNISTLAFQTLPTNELIDGSPGIAGPDMKHSQVVGCGSKAFRDWRAGCCEGTGGCTDNCSKTPEYCD